MTSDELRKAKKVEEEIFRTKSFIRTLKNNRVVKIFNKPKKMGVTISDYMRSFDYYELNENQRNRLIEMLEEDLASLENELKEM